MISHAIIFKHNYIGPEMMKTFQAQLYWTRKDEDFSKVILAMP
jgi:hypothetical protein